MILEPENSCLFDVRKSMRILQVPFWNPNVRPMLASLSGAPSLEPENHGLHIEDINLKPSVLGNSDPPTMSLDWSRYAMQVAKKIKPSKSVNPGLYISPAFLFPGAFLIRPIPLSHLAILDS